MMRTKFSASVMLLAILSQEEHIILPHGLPQDFTAIVATYIEVLEEVINPWINSLCNRSYLLRRFCTVTLGLNDTRIMADNFHDNITHKL